MSAVEVVASMIHQLNGFIDNAERRAREYTTERDALRGVLRDRGLTNAEIDALVDAVEEDS